MHPGIQELHRLMGCVLLPVLTLRSEYQYLRQAVDRWEMFAQQSVRRQFELFISLKKSCAAFHTRSRWVRRGDTPSLDWNTISQLKIQQIGR